MNTTISQVHVIVDDYDTALAFYRDGLGFAVENDVSNGDFRWITLVPPSQQGLALVLAQPHAGRSPEDGDALAALLAKGELGSLHLRTDDLDATFATLAEVPGVEVVQEPADQFWGVRDAALRDPAGNLLRVEQA